jgi:hypothetical protein
MSLRDDYDPEDGPPTKELKPLKPATEPKSGRDPAARIDLDAPDRIFDQPLPSSRPKTPAA